MTILTKYMKSQLVFGMENKMIVPLSDEEIGYRIRKRRKYLKMTQKELADLAYLKYHQKLSLIENGKRSVKVHELFGIASALKVDASEILSKEGIKDPPPIIWCKVDESCGMNK